MQAVYSTSKNNVELADMGVRVVAFAIDALLLLAVIGLEDYFTISSDETAFLLKPELFLHFLLGWLYFAGAESCAIQATIGKQLLGLRVKNVNGTCLSFKKASVRYAAKPITMVIVIFRFITGNYHSDKNTLHDRLAESMVVKR
ncbi:RDD family protein [Pontibacter vulgaris]|uniref:RDD family protein n=1 Tax=Pontibacter vulgaris TaxID=2905679 RepID=UPI001FA6FEAA|nr:RDD family protein [Pontibacter vulgaris]